MWLVADYLPSAPFSLKPSAATSSGAKSLLVPTPYAVKLALVDGVITYRGLPAAKDAFTWIRKLEVRSRPPVHVAVNNCYMHILQQYQEKRKKTERGTGRVPPFTETMAFREFVFFSGGALNLAFRIDDLSSDQRSELAESCRWLTYIGKRGCFIQFSRTSEVASLPSGFILGEGEPPPLTGGVAQFLDDMAHSASFDEVDIFSPTRLKSRRTFTAFLPYRRVRSSRGFTHYTRSEG